MLAKDNYSYNKYRKELAKKKKKEEKKQRKLAKKNLKAASEGGGSGLAPNAGDAAV